jgi:hypothetical protein
VNRPGLVEAHVIWASTGLTDTPFRGAALEPMPIMENVVRKKPVLAGRPVRATPTQREEAEVAAALAAIARPTIRG